MANVFEQEVRRIAHDVLAETRDWYAKENASYETEVSCNVRNRGNTWTPEDTRAVQKAYAHLTRMLANSLGRSVLAIELKIKSMM